MAVRDEQGEITAHFDMDVLFLTRLDQKFIEAGLASAQGDLITWYRILRNIYRMIYFKIREPGYEEIEKKLQDAFENAHSKFRISNQSNNKVVHANAVSEVEDILDEIDLLLSTLLNDYDIIFPTKKKFDPTGSIERGICGY